jgi:hypothetical protein
MIDIHVHFRGIGTDLRHLAAVPDVSVTRPSRPARLLTVSSRPQQRRRLRSLLRLPTGERGLTGAGEVPIMMVLKADIGFSHGVQAERST